MKDYITLLNKNLNLYKKDTSVCVTGIIQKRWTYRERFGIEIADLTGSIVISFANAKAFCNKNSLVKGKRVRVWGKTAVDKNGNRFIGNIEKIEILEEISLLNSELDIIEQESLVSLSKICNIIREQLTASQFIEISSRVISRRIGDEVLEPLMVDYPGFGSAVYLSPSPSSQLSEFLTVTMLPKVFTVTSSFSSSYRFPNGASELPIVMAKAINMSEEDEMMLVSKTVNLIVESLSDKSINLHCLSGLWDKSPANYGFNEDTFSFISYSTDFSTMGRLWNSVVNSIKRLLDDSGNILLECMHERINEHIQICSITFYPSQFLNWISKAPKRQIQNLWKVYDGGNLYG